MRDRPDGAALLRLARAVLLNDVLEALPEDSRYAVRLVANAAAIAARELAAGDAPLSAERDELAALFQEEGIHLAAGRATETLHESLQRLTWRLAAEIRAGGRDGDAQVHALLRGSVTRRLRESNPRVLGTADEGA